MPDLRINARWLISMANNKVTVEENRSVFVTNGRISSIEDQSSTRTAKQNIDLPKQVLMPGYVNAHGHAAMSLLRGYADDLPLMTWLNEHIWSVEGKWVGTDFVRDGVNLAIAEMLKGGTTCYADMYFYGEEAAIASVSAGVRNVSFTSVLDFPTNYANSADDYITKAMALVDTYQHEPLLIAGIGPHAPYTVSDTPFKEIAALAAEYDLPIQVHLHESAHEIQESLDKYGKRPTERLAELGFLSERVSCVHMTQITAADIQILQQTGASVVHCPESNLKLASGFCPVHNFLEAGINIGLGTDGAASNNDLSLQGEMKTAAMLAKAVAQNAEALSASQALYMATMGGAKALDLAQDIGSIEVGKWADLQAVDLSQIEQQPLFNPISQLVYTDSSRHTTHVWVAGKQLVDKGQLCYLDEDKIRYNANLWLRSIRDNG